MSFAKLTVDLEARFATLEQGLAQAQIKSERAFNSIKRSAESAIPSFDKLGAVLAGGFAGFAVSQAASSLIDYLNTVVTDLDALNDAADATGASVEALSALEDIGRRTGASFSTVTDILVKFNQQLDEAGDPNSGAAQALKSIGLEAQQLRRMDPAEALRLTARALANFADDGNKARQIQDLFGKSVRDAAPFLKDLSEVLQLNASATLSQAQAAEQFNRNLLAMQANVADLGRSLVSSLLPSINKTFDAYRDLDKLFGGLLSSPFLRGSARAGGGFFLGGDFKDAAEKTKAAIIDLEGELQQLERASRSRFSFNTEREQERVRRRIEEERSLLKFFQQRLAAEDASYSNEGRNYSADKPKLPGKKPGGGKGAGKREGRSDVLGDFIEDLEVAQRMAEKFDAEYARELAARQAEMERRFQAIEALQEGLVLDTAAMNVALIEDDRARGLAQIELDRQALQKRLDDLRLFGEDRDRIQQLIDENILTRQRTLNEQLKPQWQRQLEEWQDLNKLMAKSWDDMMNGVVDHGTDAMTRFIRTGKLNIDALADYVQEAIARMLAKQAVAELANLGNFLINGFSVTPNANGNAFAQGGQVVTAFASGGIVSRPTYFRYGGGRSGLMGEAGPEAILPLKRGPGGRLGVQASGQAGPVVNIHLPMGVTRGELAAFVPTLKAQIKAELVGSMRRPGFAGS